MSNVHIVIPVYNNWAMCHELLWNLFRKERENISSITIVNDCSTDPEVEGGIKWWCSGYGAKYPIYSITNEENVGFLLSSNKGLKSVTNREGTLPQDIIILLSTDVLIHGKFISQITDAIKTNSKSLIGGILYATSTGWNLFGNRLFPYLEGWLLATTVLGWSDLGYFDEQYVPHTFEDVDISTVAISKKYQLVPLNNVGVQHLGGKSIKYTDERFILTKVNQEKFRIKWEE